MEENRDKLLEDEDAFNILKSLYNNHPQALHLPYLNQKVKLLQQYELITPAISSWQTDSYNPHLPYILQPEAEKRIKDKLKKSTTY